MARWVLHVDLDQFLAAAEMLRDPGLRGRPVVVGGDGDPGKRGVVSTASYEARAFGVHSGLPLRTAARRCPEAVFLPVDRPYYEGLSGKVMAALREVIDEVEVLGWDEAFLGAEVEDPLALAREVQQRVVRASGLECSVGVGVNRLQAKTATGFGKPAGIFQITGATWFEVLGDRRTDALWGIGAKTAKRLDELGIHTVLDLANADETELAARFGPMTGPWLVRLARGRDSNRVSVTGPPVRSRSREVTFQSDQADWTAVRGSVVELARQVSRDVAAEGRVVVRVVVKVRFAPFSTHSRGVALDEPSVDPDTLVRVALHALDRFEPGRPVRLVGVRAELEEG